MPLLREVLHLLYDTEMLVISQCSAICRFMSKLHSSDVRRYMYCRDCMRPAI